MHGRRMMPEEPPVEARSERTRGGIRYLALLLTCLAWTWGQSALAQSSCDASQVKDALKAASQAADVMAEMPAGYGKAPDKLGKPLQALRLAALASEKMCGCSGAADVMGCLQASIDKQFICDLYDVSGLPDFTNPFSVMSIYFPPVGIPLAVAYELRYGDNANPFCAPGGGQSNLVCCKYNPSQRSCHMGFAGQHAANCLGAQPPNNPQQFGPVEVGPFGPTCDHIPDCVYGGVGDTSEFSQAARQTQWMRDLTEAYADAAFGGNSSTCSADLAMLVGCRGWLPAVRDGYPFVGLQNAQAVPTGSQLHTLRSDLLALGAQRVMYAIPNGLARFEYISSRTWTAADKAAYLGSVQPRRELNNWLSQCGLELLETTLPQTWELMAVPAPGEGPLDRTASEGWVDGCLRGKRPTRLVAEAELDGLGIHLRVEVDDPEADPANQAVNPVSVDWGDGRVTGEVYRHGRTNIFQYEYLERVPRGQIRLVYLNDAGYSIEHQLPIP